MRAAFLAEDRPELKFASKEVARHMSSPCSVPYEALKRIGRYLVKHPRLVQRMQRQEYTQFCDGYGDADHAGCLRTRRSTICCVLMYGGLFLKCFRQEVQQAERMEKAGEAASKESTMVNLASGQGMRPTTS